MKHAKFLNILVACTLVLAAACQSSTSKTNDKPTDIVTEQAGSHKILFRDSFPKPVGNVNDFDSLYSPSERLVLDSLIGDFEKATTMQIALITFNTTMLDKDSLESLTTRIGNIWDVGKKDKNNGLTIGICKGYRKMTIRNGLGTEKILSDEETKSIIDNSFLPSFKESNYFEGTLTGLKALMTTLRKKLGS